MNNPAYKYMFYRGWWVVYQMHYNHSNRACMGTKMGEYATKSEAERETYRLNGWKPKN